MVLGFIAAAGAALAGYGIFRGATDAGKAARRVGRGTEDTLDSIRKEVTQVRVFLTNTAWPEVNKTLVQFRGVLDRADVFLMTSTFTVKVLALFLALCAAYMTHKIISGRNFVPQWMRRRGNNFTATVENTVLQIVYSLCLLIALVLVLQLLRDLFNISWPHAIPLVVIVPSLATLVILYQHLVATVKFVLTLLRLIPYVIIKLPINMGLNPVTKGSGYMETILPLQLCMCIIYLVLYSFVPYGAYLLLDYLTQSEESVLKCLLIGYGVFCGATMMIGVLGALIIKLFIRPMWACLAIRNL